MEFYATHTSNKFIDICYILIPQLYELENPASERIVLIYKTNVNYKWFYTLSSPSA
jgi:hypothetical protein